MVGSTDGMGQRMRPVEGAGGDYIGMLPVALSKDMDPVSRIVYVLAGNREYQAVAKSGGVCRLTRPQDAKRVRPFAYKES